MGPSKGEKNPEAGFVLRSIEAILLECCMVSIEEYFARVRRDFGPAIGKFHDFVQKGDIYRSINELATGRDILIEGSPCSVRGGAGSSCPASSIDLVGDACGRIGYCS